MRFIFLCGGFLGFSIVMIAGLLADRPMDLVLRDAALGCLFGACVLRWFWTIFLSALAVAVKNKRAARAAQEEAAAAAKATPVAAAKVK